MRPRLLTYLLLPLAGCGAPMGAPCPEGTRCDQAPSAALRFAAELIPPDRGGELVAQEVAQLSFDEHGGATVRLAPRCNLSGRVVGAGGEPVPAQVILRRKSNLPGIGDVALQVATTAGSPDGSGGPPAGSFTLAVPRSPDLTYTLTVLPKAPFDGVYPPTSMAVAPRTEQVTILAGLPDPRHSLVLYGWVVGPLDDGRPGGRLADVRVLAVDPTTYEARSSVAVTGAEGEFRLVLSPQVAPSDRLRIVAVPAPKSLQPMLERDVAVADDPLRDNSGKLVGGKVQLRLPALPLARPYVLPIAGRGPAGALMPVGGARVTYDVELGLGGEATRAFWRGSVLTDENGTAPLDLVPGDKQVRSYLLQVTPPAASAFARTTITVAAGLAGGVLATAELATRPMMSGHLVGPGGQPVKGAIVAAQPSRLITGEAMGAPSTVTGADGAFAMRLDRGTWDIELVPPPSAPLVRWSLDNRAVTDGDVDLRTVPLPSGVLTRLTVLDPDGRAVRGVTARVYGVSWSEPCPANRGDCALPPRLRAEGTTGADGVASLLLPSP